MEPTAILLRIVEVDARHMFHWGAPVVATHCLATRMFAIQVYPIVSMVKSVKLRIFQANAWHLWENVKTHQNAKRMSTAMNGVINAKRDLQKGFAVTCPQIYVSRGLNVNFPPQKCGLIQRQNVGRSRIEKQSPNSPAQIYKSVI